jgi:SRSO17 transposase
MKDVIETVPPMALTAEEIPTLLQELSSYHAIYSPLFQRREQRMWSAQYLRGLLMNIPRKSIEPMVRAMQGAEVRAVRAMQQFLSEGAWDDEAILYRHWQEVDTTLGDADGVLIVDGSNFPKQGQHSVGVKRQSCGNNGRRANCQAGVFIGYASPHGYTLLDRRLYLPREWVEDAAYAERRRCGVPEGVLFQAKPELALAMIQAVVATGRLRCRWMTCDDAFGQDPELLDNVAKVGLWYFAEIPHDTRVWRAQPVITVPAGSCHGRKPRRKCIAPGEPAAQTVAILAATLPTTL